MATTSMLHKVTCLVVLFLVLGIPLANATLSCGEIMQAAKPCFGYVSDQSSNLPAACCDGVRKISDNAQTVDGQKDTCKCFQSFEVIQPINAGVVANLSTTCGVSFSIPIDCDAIGNRN